MKLKKLIMVALLLATTGMFFMTACKKDAIAFKYDFLLFSANEPHALVLDKFTSPIASVSCAAEWLTVTASEEMVNGYPVLVMTSSINPTQLVEATVKVKSESGELAEVRVRQGIFALGDAFLNENMQFITDWENCDTVRINGLDDPVATPWNHNSENNIPKDILGQYTKADGWEMAFCSLHNTTTPHICFFALYNKWSGILRVFHYIIDPSGYGNEIGYSIWMGENAKNNAPFYNSLEYGIPANHEMGTSLKPYANFIGGGGREIVQQQSFQSWITPYLKSPEALTSGWYCFDIDMTGYVPSGYGFGLQWREVQDDPKLSIVPVSVQYSTLTLRGSLVGNLSGTFDNPQMVQHGGGNAMSGICGILSQITGDVTSNIGSAVEYANAMKSATGIAEYLTPLKYFGGLAGNLAVSLIGMIGDHMSEPPSYDYIPGRMDMKLDAQIDLSGVISDYVSIDQAIYNVTYDNINASNGTDGHMGRGIWSLADDPVVYIDKDDLISEYDHFTIMDNGDGSGYTASDFETYGVRFMWLFDPTSVKVNLNRDFFPDVTEVKVTTTCGVYTGRPVGNSDVFRDFLTLDERPTFSLNSDTTTKIVRLGPDSSPTIRQASRDSLLITGNLELETADNCEMVIQDSCSNYRYYGYNAIAANKTVMVDPQAYLPYNGGSIDMPKAPDFIVTVNVVFESAGNTLLYSKCFVPKIQIVDRATTLQLRDKLQQYHDQCQNGQPTGTIANASNVPVYSPDGDRLIQRTLVRLGLIQ